jgi:malonyl-CoA/methylmalonyl-CoA synthetase
MYKGNLLASVLRNASVGRDSKVFATLSVGDETLTYGQLWDNSRKVASALVGAGVMPGDRVAVQVEKSLAALELYLGTILAGGVHLPLNTAYTPSELDYFLGDAEPKVFVCDTDRAGSLERIAARAGVSRVFTLTPDGLGSLTDAVEAASRIPRAVPRKRDDLAAILYTSGTTGRSKGAMLTHGNLASNAQVLTGYWHFTDKDVLIHALPIFHTHGLFVATNVALTAGASLIYHAKFDAAAVLADFARATTLMGVPTFYTRLLDMPKLTKKAGAGMRLFISGSAPLLAETHVQWQESTGKAILERYGMTETCMNTSNPYDGPRKPGTVGLPLPGVEVRIVDENANTVPNGEIGGIEVRGPNVFKGYWRMPEKTAAELREDGFFITGDVGMIDEDGYVSIIGRSKDLIISGGFNIYPKEIELVVDEVDGVKESAVFGVPHPDFGEGVAVAVVPENGAQLTEEDLVAAVAPHLARFKHPRRVVFLDALPRNAMGKVQKNQLRDSYADAFAK